MTLCDLHPVWSGPAAPMPSAARRSRAFSCTSANALAQPWSVPWPAHAKAPSVPGCLRGSQVTKADPGPRPGLTWGQPRMLAELGYGTRRNALLPRTPCTGVERAAIPPRSRPGAKWSRAEPSPAPLGLGDPVVGGQWLCPAPVGLGQRELRLWGSMDRGHGPSGVQVAQGVQRQDGGWAGSTSVPWLLPRSPAVGSPGARAALTPFLRRVTTWPAWPPS